MTIFVVSILFIYLAAVIYYRYMNEKILSKNEHTLTLISETMDKNEKTLEKNTETLNFLQAALKEHSRLIKTNEALLDDINTKGQELINNKKDLHLTIEILRKDKATAIDNIIGTLNNIKNTVETLIEQTDVLLHEKEVEHLKFVKSHTEGQIEKLKFMNDVSDSSSNGFLSKSDYKIVDCFSKN